MKIEVHLQGGLRKVIDITPGATIGATIGTNVYNADGSLFVPIVTPSQPNVSVTSWNLILDIPPNVSALASVSGAGLYTITGPGTSTTREIVSSDGSVTIAHGNGVSGNPDLSVPIPLNPYAIFIVDELGNFIVDEDGNYIVSDTGYPINPVFLPPHNSINGLQGGNSTERYHLTAAELSAIIATITAGTTGQFRRGDNTWANQLLGPLGLGGMSAGSPTGIFLYMANVTTPPAGSPTGGGVIYVESGALKYRGSSGTITTIGPA